MTRRLGLLAAGLLSLAAAGCAGDGYGFGSDFGFGPSYGYAPGPAYAPGYGDALGYRTCVRRERVWDPYTRRTITVRHRYAC